MLNQCLMMRNEWPARSDYLSVQKDRILIEKEQESLEQTEKMLAKVDRITDVRERMQMYRYMDSVQESLRHEAREVRDAHFEAVRDPSRTVAKLELKKKHKELNRGYKFIKI